MGVEGVVKRLRVLHVEDREDDSLLLARALRRGGYELVLTRVETEEAMRRALREGTWDIVVSDYALPEFSGPEALRVLKESGKDLPIIIMSGTIGEDTAVEALQAGADDFIVKGRFARLLPAVERSLHHAAERRQRTEAEAELRERDAQYRRIVEMAQEGIWTVDVEGRTTFVNPAMARMLGVDREALMGQPASDYLHESQREHLADLWAPGSEVAQRELRFVRRDGTEFWGLTSVSVIRDQDGAEHGHLGMIADITKERQLHEQLMIADRMASIGMVAAGVAHEINNPLAAVLSNLQEAAHELAGVRGPAAEAVREALEAAEHLRAVAHDLKVFSRDAREEERGPVDLRRVIDSAVRMARTELRHRARLMLELGPVPWVAGNESRLGQVFLNLLVNAAQAIPEDRDGTVRVVTRTGPDGWAEAEVCDDGTGMSAEVQARLFTTFFTTKPSGVGTGLGLSICQRIVGGLGGTIEVESVVGRGSVFRVRLPPGAAPEVRSEPARPAGSGALRGGRVLIVDDERLIVRTLQRLLTGYEVTAHTSSSEALETLERGAWFDIIFCDLMMPGLSGMDLYERLSQTRPAQADRMVFMTGGAFTERAQAFLRQVANPRLDKPFDGHTVKALVAEWSQRGAA